MDYQSEDETRNELIDPKLEAAGWKIVRHDPSKPLDAYDGCAVTEYHTALGPADYVLCKDGKILGVVEAKKVRLDPHAVLSQAERYSKGATDSPLQYGEYRVPFLYSTNGPIIWHQDIRHSQSRSRTISGFHTPDALAEKLEKNFPVACAELKGMPNDHSLLRPYQAEGNQAIEKAIAARTRQMLVAMATGTGKTFLMVNEAYRLMKSGVAKRILFLVDRRALAAQAVRTFASFEPEPGLKFNQIYEVYSQKFQKEDLDENEKFDPQVLPSSYLLKPHLGDAFVYVCTIQRMTVNLFGRGAVFSTSEEPIDEDAEQIDIPIHAFDAVIADECHRGYTTAELSVWRNTLDHFDAIKIGLTATPAAHTKAYFHDVVYRYEYERAVSEGYLVDYDAVAVNSDVRMKGIFLDEGELVRVVDTRSGSQEMDLLDDERQFDSSDVERKITSPDSNRKILEEINKYALEHQQKHGRFPKTLIFAVNDLEHTSHADSLVQIARDVFGKGDAFVRKITCRVDRPLQRIREFRNRKLPGIVVTVDMLSTGVDIPDLEYIVFLRPVKSRILFEQMLGRGTRKGETYQDKSHFTVFDCFDGTLLEYFKNSTGITADPPRREARPAAQVIEDIWADQDRPYNIRCLVKRLLRIDKEMAPEARKLFARFISEGDVARFARELPHRSNKNFTAAMETLSDPDFQNALLKFPRPQRTFLIADETEDAVGSTWLISDTSGKEYKPEDYITAFTRFVKENATRIQAIEILLNRPQDWSSDALSELRNKLQTASQHFTERNLQKAHQDHYNKSLVDIISMVKHAAREEEPLLSASERASRAFAKLTADKTFTAEQQQWLGRIRVHMMKNLSLSQEDFDAIPIFNRFGGWAKADKVFDGKLSELIREFNEAVAA